MDLVAQSSQHHSVMLHSASHLLKNRLNQILFHLFKGEAPKATIKNQSNTDYGKEPLLLPKSQDQVAIVPVSDGKRKMV